VAAGDRVGIGDVTAVRCLSCHYDLRKLSEHRCPECGREFDPSDSKTFEDDKLRQRIRNARFGTWVCLVFMVVHVLLAYLTHKWFHWPFVAVFAVGVFVNRIHYRRLVGDERWSR
jgi:hypothetical protein